jgi:hypothetical protein
VISVQIQQVHKMLQCLWNGLPKIECLSDTLVRKITLLWR